MLEQQIINTLVIGSMYTLVAIGFTLFFGILNLINFAHGEVFMLGAFAALVFYNIGVHFGLTDNPYIIILVMLIPSGIFCGCVGILVEKITFMPVRKSPPLVLLLTSLAVSIIIRESVMTFFPDGANPQVFPDPFCLKSVTIGPVVVGYIQFFLIGTPLVLLFLLYILISRTKLGRAIRAISEDMEAAEMMGVDINRTISTTFFIGSALGAIAGVMNGMNYGSVKFDMGFMTGIKGFTSAVIGGLGNIYGAMAGGYILAFLEVFTTSYIPRGSAYKDVVAFAILILILVFKPSGILTYGLTKKS